ncbi:hypothetical protein EJB05_12979, partial [Eragrostis curvula]
MQGYGVDRKDIKLRRAPGSSTAAESSELKQIPVVIMSSENVPTRINRCLEEGAEDFLLKPVRPSDISRISSRMLQST